MNLNHFVVLYKIDRYCHKRRRRVLREKSLFYSEVLEATHAGPHGKTPR